METKMFYDAPRSISIGDIFYVIDTRERNDFSSPCRVCNDEKKLTVNGITFDCPVCGGQSTTAGAVKKRARRRDKNLYNLTVEIPRDVAERVFAPAALRKLGYLSKSDFVRQAVAALDAKLSTIESKEKTADAGTSDGE